MTTDTLRIKLAARPQGLPSDDIWTLERAPAPEPGPGQAQVRTLYVSIDPAMRGWLEDRPSYIRPVALGEVMRAWGVGEVVASCAPGLSAGDVVVGPLGWQEVAVVEAEQLQKIDLRLAPAPAWLGVLGMTGLTAYFGLLDVGQPKPGQTVLVSAAAGATGSVVGQIARIMGCRAVGIAGGPEKCRQLTELYGMDAAIDYKAGKLSRAIAEACPDKVDVYFDNVGGETLEAALRHLNRHARVVICGAISGYNDAEPPAGPRNYLSLLVNRARMEGFLVFDYADRYPEAIGKLAGWIAQGQLVHREHVVEGLEMAPEALRMLFRGENQGKLVVKVAEPGA